MQLLLPPHFLKRMTVKQWQTTKVMVTKLTFIWVNSTFFHQSAFMLSLCTPELMAVIRWLGDWVHYKPKTCVLIFIGKAPCSQWKKNSDESLFNQLFPLTNQNSWKSCEMTFVSLHFVIFQQPLYQPAPVAWSGADLHRWELFQCPVYFYIYDCPNSDWMWGHSNLHPGNDLHWRPCQEGELFHVYR